LEEHLGYVSDTVRLECYKAAVAQAVKAGDRIMDLGCGTGILGLLCLEAGAEQVYAVDSSQMLEVARESLVRAGWGGQVIFIRSLAHQAELPERVDVVICDQVGYFGFDYGILYSLTDARRRFLKQGGTLIPSQIKLHLALVESDSCHRLAEGWLAECVPDEFRWLNQYATNTKQAALLSRDELLSQPAELGCIDFREDNPEFFSWETQLSVARDGTLHGLGGWFNCELAAGVWMTNSPLADRPTGRAQAFLPIGEGVEVKSGDQVHARVMARPADWIIAWEVEIPSIGRKFSHSTWRGQLITPAKIAKQNPAHIPKTNREGKARMIVLGLCDGLRTVQQIKEIMLREYPGLFPSAEESTRFVGHVLDKDTE
jgi:protein arginine N-methyltransferase 1